MIASRYLAHVTTTTGHVRRSLRSEVSDEALRVCDELIDAAARDGGAMIPHAGPYLLRVEPPTKCLWATVHRVLDPVLMRYSPPLATIAVATGSRCAVPIWRRLLSEGVPPDLGEDDRPATPWVAVRIELPAVGDPALHWLGDFERCLAWAFVERGR